MPTPEQPPADQSPHQQLWSRLTELIDEIPLQYETRRGAEHNVALYCQTAPLGQPATLNQLPSVESPLAAEIKIINLCIASLGRAVQVEIEDQPTGRKGFVNIVEFQNYNPADQTWMLLSTNGRARAQVEIKATQLAADMKLV